MNDKYALITKEHTLREAIQRIDEVGGNGGEPGIAIVIDENQVTQGVLTDGDIRNLFCREVDFNDPVGGHVSGDFVHVYDDQPPAEQFKSVLSSGTPRARDPKFSQVIVVDREKRFKAVLNLFDLYRSGDVTFKKIAVYGLGYVGLTLALTMAELGLEVTGLDINPDLIANLNKGVPPFYENGLNSLLDHCLSEEKIRFCSPKDPFEADIHFIAVGTPVDPQQNVIFDYLEMAGATIGDKLKPRDLVLCRSTVPVGTTRNRLIPQLESRSGLTVGKDFHVAFAPERTVEGNALRELRTLPQVIGGYSPACTDFAEKLFARVNSTIVKVAGLEAAEVVKLINNTFRDTVFSFANDITLLCDEYNINAFEVIQAANEGYPRNPIPLPSPGVGGICLAKDPHLYKHSIQTKRDSFGPISRNINQSMPAYVFRKFRDYAAQMGIGNEPVLIVGMAFKGRPETSDMRYSPSVDLARLLVEAGFEVLATDYVVPADEMREVGVTPVAVEDGLARSRAVFVMNNHPDNRKFEVYKLLSETVKPFFFFDGWHAFSRHEIESIKGVSYATLGYVTEHHEA